MKRYVKSTTDEPRYLNESRHFYESSVRDSICKPHWNDQGKTTKDKGGYELPKENLWHGSDHLWD